MRPFHPLLLAVVALSACQEVSIGVRNSIPTVSITSHFDGDPVTEGFPFLVRASAGDSDSQPEDLVATWYAANNLVPECNKIPVSEDGVTECTVSLFTQSDPPRVSVDVRDVRGGTGSAAVTLDVLPASGGYEAPDAEILDPLDGALLLGGEPVLFEGRVSDLQDAATDLAIEWTSSLDGVLSTQGADSNGTSLFVQPVMQSGTHIITLRVTDTEGNFTTDVITVDVNGAPTAPVVAINPDPAPSSQDLQATILTPSTDPEGDPITYTYEWLKDGVPQGGLTSALVLSPETSRGETWTVRVRPFDGSSTGAFGEDSVVIQNAPPVVQSVTVTPTPAFTSSVLTANPTSLDADGDVPTHSYDWFVNGVSTGQTTSTLDGLTWFDKGDLVQVYVTANDGSGDSAPLGSNVVVIQNSAPTMPDAEVAPTVPIEGNDDLICSMVAGSTDADGDPITYDFAWDVDGVPYPRVGDLGPFQTVYIDDSATAADTLDGETWTCAITATDDEGLGSVPGEDSVTIGRLVFLPDYDGTFDIVPDILYTCAGGLVSINVQQLTFSDTGTTLSVTGAPRVMTSPSPVDENFSVQGVIAGGCTETYTLGGTFQDNDHFIGTLGVMFTGWQCGLTNCTNQSWPVDGYRL